MLRHRSSPVPGRAQRTSSGGARSAARCIGGWTPRSAGGAARRGPLPGADMPSPRTSPRPS
eukprot:13823651-Alexandrium_andersonii.AAC.1